MKSRIAILSLAFCAALPATAAELTGRAYVIDGDTLDMHGTRIRIWGVDAVESSQMCALDGRPTPCGRQAANDLADWIGARTVFCVPTGEKTYERYVAKCSVGGEDIGAHQVTSGWAYDVPRFSKGAYAELEARARAARAGVHGYDGVQNPLAYRRSKQ